ncbi:unnamed protein product (macronuclear) [Paramecium tetraurelia]|uniref:Uncharacterized protein n=1 Tax=Paramecium tetraurelia TaxID=5888 RepID=A0DZV6_PARTE|nr:uncharacterized protein GSPATT00021741001 [Paramecium tetraurelia]CAK88573.1 unnamed protein product [Paramecium tetraurelia]|eukprot:XP_001455970.1 hypothetical protein (macronuclear) [Paramecium tetraurelia strain d4-2]
MHLEINYVYFFLLNRAIQFPEEKQFIKLVNKLSIFMMSVNQISNQNEDHRNWISSQNITNHQLKVYYYNQYNHQFEIKNNAINNDFVVKWTFKVIQLFSTSYPQFSMF